MDCEAFGEADHYWTPAIRVEDSCNIVYFGDIQRNFVIPTLSRADFSSVSPKFDQSEKSRDSDS